MRKKTLVHVPIGGDYQKQLAFENEMHFVKILYVCDWIDLITTLKTNRLKNTKKYRDRLFKEGPQGEYGSRLFDHYYLAQTESGKKYFVAEPYIGEPTIASSRNGNRNYFVYEECVAAVAKWCRNNGLNLEVRLHGPHCKDSPPTTMFIISGYDGPASEER